jgi:malonate decarboxylase gamma subunit
MNASKTRDSRGGVWFHALATAESSIETGLCTVLAADVQVAGQPAGLIAVVPDALDDHAANSPGGGGLEEGWVLADQIRAAARCGVGRPIITIVDARNQMRGRIEDLLGISCSCAAAADAYAAARRAGHPLIALVVGSRAHGTYPAHGYQAHGYQAHGYQAHRVLAFDAAATGLAGLGSAAASSHAGLSAARHGERGQLYQLIRGIDADAPSRAQIGRVKERIALAIADIRNHPGDPALRLGVDLSILDLATSEVPRPVSPPRYVLDETPVLESAIVASMVPVPKRVRPYAGESLVRA